MAMAFTILGMIACLEGNIEEMHSCHKNAMTYSNNENFTMVQYATSLMNSGFFEDAYDYSLKVYKKDYLDMQNLNNLIEITNKLDLEDEFQKYVAEWEKATGEIHSLISFPEDNDEKLEAMLDKFERLINDHPDLIIKPDPEIIKLANDLVKGVGDN